MQSNMLKAYAICFFLAAALVGQISGHGSMIEPPNRSSLWRYDSSAPANYNDKGVFCGGKGVMWDENGGKCGLCGDAYNLPHPQPNENTGTYGQGKVVKTYSSGNTIPVTIAFETNHKGFFNFSLCQLQNPNAPEPGESCFQALTLSDGAREYRLEGDEGARNINLNVRLPSGLRCDRCVLRWHYSAGNGWGTCADGSSALGCGPQETYRNCADIAIH